MFRFCQAAIVEFNYQVADQILQQSRLKTLFDGDKCFPLADAMGFDISSEHLAFRSQRAADRKSSIFKRTRSHPRGLLSIARLNIARSRLRALI